MVLGEAYVVSSFEPSGVHGAFYEEGPAVDGLESTGVDNVEDGSLRLGDIGVDGTGGFALETWSRNEEGGNKSHCR